ncbi:hypothetical protein N7540_006689 [Penicillium herquei]|nr:hypothetical protein N7540_006689 [Penicillium herquei]
MIRIFGDLWLPDPRQCLPAQELININKLLPLIQKLDADQNSMSHDATGPGTSSEWNMNEAYESFLNKEIAWWRERGVIRPKYLVRPSGLLNAPVACHLYNPTFTVDDPQCCETEHLSNPSIAQLHTAGFSSQNNCLLFGHIAHRDISRHCVDVYPEDLLEIHEEFLFSLRAAMKAKVEICWGANVRERMVKKLNLQPFRLWGDYAGLVLYLELLPNLQSMKRFIIFVAHPQRFLYVKSNGERARSWRRRFGLPQDQALAVAACLGGIQVPQGFYELDPRLPQNLCVPRKVSDQRNLWKAQAIVQLKTVFPSAVLSTDTSHFIRPTKEDFSSVQNAFTSFSDFKLGTINTAVNVPSTNDDLSLRKKRIQKIVDYWINLEALSSMFLPNTGITHYKTGYYTRDVKPLPSDISQQAYESDCWSWDDLPGPLAEFLQTQDGLKFNRRKISSRGDLEVASYLLQKCKGDPKILDILTLAFQVLAAYGWMIARPRLPQVDDMLILRESPYDIVPRRCSACGNEYLDDPFAYWSKLNPNRYVLWCLYRSSCGRPGCETNGSELLPLDSQIRYLRSTQKDLAKESLKQFDEWFLLRPEEFGDLPREVEVECQTNECEETRVEDWEEIELEA